MTISGTDFLDAGLAALLDGSRPRRRLFPGDPAQVAHARRFVRRALAGHRAASDAALLTSELATNAICHTTSGQGGTFEIVVNPAPGDRARRSDRRRGTHRAGSCRSGLA